MDAALCAAATESKEPEGAWTNTDVDRYSHDAVRLRGEFPEFMMMELAFPGPVDCGQDDSG